MLRGWLPFYTTSVRLGLRNLLRGHRSREAVIRVLAPIEDARFFELPATVSALDVHPGERVLDLASPKLAAVELARRGASVVSVDQFEPEVAEWQALTQGVSGLEVALADGRELPFPDASFDHAYSISVIEHIGDDGDFKALGELARVVRPGGRIVLTFPFGVAAGEDWRDAPVYGAGGAQSGGRWFYQRIYDEQRVDRLLSEVPLVEETARRAVSFKPTRFYAFYARHTPWTLPLGPVLGWTARLAEGPGGLLMLTLRRLPPGA
jgi:SAM-dependent methyltransferase